MYLPNQAGYGVWFQQNNAPKWRVYLTLLYSAVLDGLGTQVLDTGVFTLMRQSEFSAETRINALFLQQHPVDDATQTALYTDPYYGLDNADNYMHWQALYSGADPNEQLAFKAELRTYFGLS